MHLPHLACLVLLVLATAVHCGEWVQVECSATNIALLCDGGIPPDVPAEPTDVYVENLKNSSGEVVSIHSMCFIGDNWSNVKRLTISSQMSTTIEADAFMYLQSLTYLGLHRIQVLSIDANAFSGLPNLYTLDIVYGRSLTLDAFIPSLNGPEKVPHLSTLNLIDISFGKSMYLRRSVVEVLASKPLTSLDLSRSTISYIDFQAVEELLCDKLVHFACTKCSFGSMNFTYGFCRSLKSLDLRYAFTQYELPHPSVGNALVNIGPFTPMFNFFSHIDTIDLSSCFLGVSYFPALRNITVISSNASAISNPRSLSLANSKIRYLDVKFPNSMFMLQNLNLSSNNMEYLQPNLLPDNNSLYVLDISDNNLEKMASNNYTDFAIMLWNYENVSSLSLRSNRLFSIPTDMFSNLKKLTYLDLSQNYIQDVDLIRSNYSALKSLDLSNCNISTLSSSTRSVFQILITRNNLSVDLRGNPIQCASCEDKDCIEWIHSALGKVMADYCRTDEGLTVTLDEGLSILQQKCKNNELILMASLTISATLALCVMYYMVKFYRRLRFPQSSYKHLVEDIHNDRHEFRYVAFLAFSGNDETFVEAMIKEPLEQHLRSIIPVKKELICTGDRNFRLGFTIADQTDACCAQSGAVILVISKSFCKSIHCNNEAQIAYTSGKPIILMCKERVEPCDMSPLLRVIFRQYTRVTWKLVNGRYELSTSWNNICESLLQSMENV